MGRRRRATGPLPRSTGALSFYQPAYVVCVFVFGVNTNVRTDLEQKPTPFHPFLKTNRNLGYEFGHLVPSAAEIITMLPYEKAFTMTAYSRDKYEYQVGRGY